jgi:hypothetical protein
MHAQSGRCGLIDQQDVFAAEAFGYGLVNQLLA